MVLATIACVASAAGDALTDASARIGAEAVPAEWFGGATAGAMGDLGRALSAQMTAVVEARSGELRAAGNAAGRLASALDRAAIDYGAADAQASSRHGGA